VTGKRVVNDCGVVNLTKETLIVINRLNQYLWCHIYQSPSRRARARSVGEAAGRPPTCWNV